MALVDDLPYDEAVLTQTRLSFTDIRLEWCFRQLLTTLVPEYQLPSPVISAVDRIEGQFKILTTINFEQANKLYHRRVPASHSSFSNAYLLSNILSAHEKLHLASKFSSEIAATEAHAKLIELNVETLVRTRSVSETISHFQEMNFDDGRALREAINSGSRTFRDLLLVLDRAEKFRTWLHTTKPDIDLFREYYAAIRSESWIDKLPGKSLRWTVFTGTGMAIDLLSAGVVGTAAGLTLSAVDQFLLDRIIKGWQPSQFIEGSLRKFVQRDK